VVLQKRELLGFGLSARVRAIAALLRVLSLRVLALVTPLLQVSFLKPENKPGNRKVFFSGAAVHIWARGDITTFETASLRPDQGSRATGGKYQRAVGLCQGLVLGNLTR